MFALLDALDHLYICLSTMYRTYEKTVVCLSLTALLTKYEHEVNKRAGSADRLKLPPDIIVFIADKTWHHSKLQKYSR